ncbi:MAG: S41 family peptidase [Pelagibacteraceae bacterium TMED246]|nr:MAG: S41 family peptidase [Pelagibacteraceae bacterium TMED246]|tara:strand:- start:1613 stop:3160 length:1548 start_codon:yes stop_codon:yes gene_type:complete
MRKIKYIYIIILSVVIFIAFKSNSENDPYLKLKTLTQVIRLVQDGYFKDVDMTKALEGAIRGFLEELDPHSKYISNDEFEAVNEQMEGEFEGIGIEYSMLDGYITVISPIPGTPSDRAGIQSGDKIIEIDGKSAYKLKTEDVIKKLRGTKGSSVIVKILRQDREPFNLNLIRDKIPITSVIASYMIDLNIGYVKINRFANNTAEELKYEIKNLELEGMNKLILDLRNNGGGLLDQAVEIVDMFINSFDTIVYTEGKLRNANEVFYARQNFSDINYPIAILINNGSASASEIVSGAIQDLDRGYVIGERSFGKGLVQRQYTLEDGSAARITVAQYFTPAGRLIQRNYDDGIGEYYTEKAIEDTVLNNKTLHYTKNGRTVYGGGGIWPDEEVSLDEKYIEYLNSKVRLNTKRPIFKYATNIKNTIPINSVDELYVSLKEDFKNKKIKDQLIELSKLKIWLNEEEITYDDNIEELWPYIKIDILSEIVNAQWSKNDSYKIKSITDNQIGQAVTYLKNK